MKIWIVATGEPWPSDEGTPRLLRGGVLARQCAAEGDEVTWWNTTFDHRLRRDRFEGPHLLRDEHGVHIRGLYAPVGYRRSVSLQRIVNHHQVGRDFRRQIQSCEPPDVILACMPLVELAHEAVQFGVERNIPVMVDLRDKWPEIWLEPLPPLLHPIGRLCLHPWQRQLARALQQATALSGISETFLDWGLDRAARARSPLDRVVPLAPDHSESVPDDLAAAREYWQALGLPAEGGFTVCYMGTLANRVGTRLIVDAARLIPEDRRNRIRFVIAGEGEALPDLQDKAAGLEHVLLPGWVDQPRLAALKQLSSAGLMAYPNQSDFISSIPNKVVEYLAAGLPVISTLEGEVERLITRSGAGVHIGERKAEALARTILALADAPEQTRAMTEQAAVLSRQFDPATIYGGFRDHLAKLAARA